MNKAIIKGHTWLIFSLACMSISCKKLVQAGAPITSINAQNVYTSDATAIAALTGIYAKMSSNSFNTGGFTSLSLTAGLYADELTLYSGSSNTTLRAFYTNALTNQNTGSYDVWTSTYPYIFYANSAIQGLTSNTSLTPAIQKQLLGEALFLRAFFYFYLVNFYGDVPLVMGINYTTNGLLARTSSSVVYGQIVDDLHNAQNLLSPTYLDASLLKTTTEKTRPTLWAADALLANVYLHMGNWAGADSAASAVINISGDTLSSLSNAFLRNSSEAIWQLQPVVGQTNNTLEAIYYILPSAGPSNTTNPVYLNSDLVNSFEPHDQRLTNWVGKVTVSANTYYYPNKYKINNPTTAVNEYIMVMRLAEQFLIRAEARAQEGNITGSQADLNKIRTRAALPASTASNSTDLETAVFHERRVELFTEWGNRWFDLKRTGNADAVMGTAGACDRKGGTWRSEKKLYPIPFSELQVDPNLVQNPSY